MGENIKSDNLISLKMWKKQTSYTAVVSVNQLILMNLSLPNKDTCSLTL